MKKTSIDYPFLLALILLAAVGFVIFSSAALGLLARPGAPFSSVAANQVLFGLIGGSIAAFILSRLDYKLLSRFSLPLFIFALLLTCLTFVPHIGLTLKGAHRWILIGGFSFQPAELLKFATITVLATYLAANYKKVHTFKEGFLPFAAIVGIASLPMLLQPDHHGVMVLALAASAIFFAAGGRAVYFLALGGIGVVLGALVLFTHPYALERVYTFLDPARDPQGSGYQVQQSLLAVGSGEIFGRGFGQSIQKFSHLPEPMGDSVFAVAAEEFGFAGCVFLILLFLAFAAAGLRIARKAGDRFGGLLALGIVMLIVSQSFVNILSAIGLFPLSGLPLTFVSQGGSALLIALAEAGVILSISRRIKNS